MDVVMTTLRFAAFLLSMLGYVVAARAYWRIPARFSYIFVFSLLTCVVFAAGLLGLLEYAVWGLFGLGLLLLLLAAIRKKLYVLFSIKRLTVLNAMFVLAFCVVFGSLITTRFTHYDNFSHWAIVVKNMLITDAFPNAASALIDFKTYALGTSSFIYFVCKVAGHSDGVMLVAQSLLIFGCFYAMFGVIRDTKRLLLSGLLALFGAGMTFFNISIRINTLLVDFLLPLFALASIAAIFTHRRDFTMACIISTPILAMLVIIKSSGVFFAAIAYFYLLFVALKKYNPRARRSQRVLACLLVIALSLTTLIAWNLHTAAEFSGIESKFDISAQTLSSIDKTPEQIATIIRSFLEAALDIGSLPTLGILVFNALALLGWLIARVGFKKKWALLKALIALDIAVVLYYAGILAMYIFTMPLDEALRLAGFERYASSIVILLIGGLGLCTVNDTENSLYVQQSDRRDYMAFKSLFTKTIYQAATTTLIALASLLLLSEINGMDSMKADYPDSLPARVEAITGDNWRPASDDRYLFYASDTDRQISDYYLQYIGRYMLMTPNVDALDTFDEGTFANTLARYDYFVIVETDDTITALMREHGVEAEPGIYSTQTLLAQNGSDGVASSAQ